MTAQELAASVREQLIAAANPATRDGIRHYFREPIDPYGVPTPQVRRIAAAAYKALKIWPPAQRNRFCQELWKSGKSEEGVVAIYVYRRFQKQCAACEFHLFEKWIDRFVRNWAHCDGVGSWLIAACIENEPALSQALPEWTRSPNRWKRRAAAVSLIQEAKRGRSTEMIFRIADAIAADPDDMVQKGVGWMLKEAYPPRPRAVVEFLEARRGKIPRRVLRYAAEKMKERDRAAVLG
jgi:3-methyladenine DNA glycosylase AlkD